MAEVLPGAASRSAASRRALPASCSAPGNAATLSAGPLTPTVSRTRDRSDSTTGWAARIVAANRCAAGAVSSWDSSMPAASGTGTSTTISSPSGATRASSAAGRTSSRARSQRQRSAFGPVTRSASTPMAATR